GLQPPRRPPGWDQRGGRGAADHLRRGSRCPRRGHLPQARRPSSLAYLEGPNRLEPRAPASYIDPRQAGPRVGWRAGPRLVVGARGPEGELPGVGQGRRAALPRRARARRPGPGDEDDRRHVLGWT